MKFVRILFLALALSLLTFGLVSANYIGPQRTVSVTTWERSSCNYRAYVASPSGYCFLTLYFSPGGCPATSSVQGYFNNSPTACGTSWPGTCGSGISCSITLLSSNTGVPCTAGQPGCASVSSTVTYPPATVSGATGCTVPGNNGWCRGTGTLNLSSTEPVGGYSITGIEGTPGMLCGSSTCAWTFPEGSTSLNYWALSSFGDTSLMASAAMMVDSAAPTVSLTIPTPNGSNGWNTSSLTASASGSDILSGLDSVSINAGGSTYTVSSDGVYTLTATAFDMAGNLATQTGTVFYDGTSPIVSLTIPPANGSNGWNRSSVTASASVSDATSGAASVDINGSGSTFTVSADGIYNLTATGYDVAGNSATQNGTIRFDATAPVLSVNALSPDGSGGWYVSDATVTASAGDALSGLAGVEHRVDGGSWMPGASVTISDDGSHLVEFQATDLAGNTATSSQTVSVDQTPPLSAFTSPAEGSSTFVHGEAVFDGRTLDVTSGPQAAQISLDGGSTWQPLTITGNDWTYTWDTSAVPNGTYTILVRASDVAGNEEHTASVAVTVENSGPRVSITPLWWSWEEAVIEITPGLLSVTGSRIVISDDAGHQRTYSFPAWTLPVSLKWDGIWDDGLIAPSGEYQVVVEAWDLFGNTGRASGTVRIPQPLATSTAQPTPETTPEPVIEVTAQPTATPTVAIVPATEAAPQPTPEPPTPEPIWPVTTSASLVLLFALTSLLDPRPTAWRRLARTKKT